MTARKAAEPRDLMAELRDSINKLVPERAAPLCQRCRPLDGPRKPGRPITAGCLHEHFRTITLCTDHERWVRCRELLCDVCRQAGHPLVPVRIVTAEETS